MQTNNNQRIFGVYKNETDAQRAIDDLLSMGYAMDQISILSKSNELTELGEIETSTEAGLKGGAVTGAAIGGLGGLLAGLGLLVIPGIGPILAAGPIAAAFAGALTGGAIGGTLGTLGGAMMDAGVEEADARYLEDRFSAGDIIVYVDASQEHVGRVSDKLGYRNWRTEGEFDEYNQKLIDSAPEHPDSDIHHDNMDLDIDGGNRPADPVIPADPLDEVNPLKPVAPVVYEAQPVDSKAEPVYRDSDLRHDNMDLDIEPSKLDSMDPMRITDPTSPNYRHGATISVEPVGNYYKPPVPIDEIPEAQVHEDLTEKFQHAKDRAEDFIADRTHEPVAEEMDLDETVSEHILEAKHKADLRIDELTTKRER